MLEASKLGSLLQDEQAASEHFRERIRHLEDETQQRSATIEELSRKEREFEEKCREQVRNHRFVTSQIRPLTVLGRNGTCNLPEAQKKG